MSIIPLYSTVIFLVVKFYISDKQILFIILKNSVINLIVHILVSL